MAPFKYWLLGKERVHIVERFGTTVLVEYVFSGQQASVCADRLRSVTASDKPKKTKTLKNSAQQKPAAPVVKNNLNNQISLDL